MSNATLRVIDVDKPNLYRETFPYTEFPKVVFDEQPVPYEIPEDIWITDTTFRDGQQARPPYTVAQTCELFDLLHRLSGPKGVIRQTEFFLYSEQDRQALIAHLGARNIVAVFHYLPLHLSQMGRRFGRRRKRSICSRGCQLFTQAHSRTTGHHRPEHARRRADDCGKLRL